jgi:hypothetical protein
MGCKLLDKKKVPIDIQICSYHACSRGSMISLLLSKAQSQVKDKVSELVVVYVGERLKKVKYVIIHCLLLLLEHEESSNIILYY